MAMITIQEDFLSDKVTLCRDGILVGWTEPDLTAPAAEVWPVFTATGGRQVAAFATSELALSHLRLMATRVE